MLRQSSTAPREASKPAHLPVRLANYEPRDPLKLAQIIGEHRVAVCESRGRD